MRAHGWRLGARLAVVLVCVPVAAFAHPDHTHLDGTVRVADAAPVYVYKGYTDGIFFTDPVRLELRNEQKTLLTKTRYGRDAGVLCWSASACVGFRYEGLFSVLPTEVWTVEGARFVPPRSPLLRAVGIVAPLWENRAEYATLLALYLLCAGLGLPLALVASGRLRGGRLRTTAFSVLAVIGALLLVPWLYVATMLAYTSVPLMLALVAVPSGLVWRRVRAMARVR